MRKTKVGLIILGIVMLFSGCNVFTKQFGGTSEITLPKGKKLINVTWKDANVWYLTKDMTATDKAEIYEFTEKSNLGVAQGKIIIKEVK